MSPYYLGTVSIPEYPPRMNNYILYLTSRNTAHYMVNRNISTLPTPLIIKSFLEINTNTLCT